MNQFPGTNFHDLNLDWLLSQMKNCLEEWETTKGEWESAEAEINAKIAYINNYFANLDVSDEISDKIDTMIASGELLTLIAPQVATTAQQATGDWLNAQVIPEGDSLVVIDKTLSIEGAAAEAKATGFALSKIRGAAEYCESYNVQPVEVDYPDGTGRAFAPDKRCFWPDVVPANSLIASVHVVIGNIGAAPNNVTFEVWEFSDDGTTLNKVKTEIVSFTAGNQTIHGLLNYTTKHKAMLSYLRSNAQVFYRASQTGKSWMYSNDTSTDTTSLTYNSISTFSNMTLVGGFDYITFNNPDFFSGLLPGNLVVFGDSTVDGSSTTGYSGNVIGTDRDATAAPKVFTSIVEGMLNTFTGGSKRIYNAGFGGKTLNYIADNYAGIMAAFSNVKSALLVIDANSANGTRAEYENGIRTGLERMIALLQADGIAVAIASPQPMFFYPADNGGLPAINSAGEYYIAVNIGKDVARKHNVPFIDLGGLTNDVMESAYLNSEYFYGDRIHFGDNGHIIEAYELYGELVHPIVYFNGQPQYIGIESNRGELSATSGVSASKLGGYESILLMATNTRTDVLFRTYIIAKQPFTIEGINISGWTSYYDVIVDGETYSSDSVSSGETIPAGAHEVTIKPTATGHVVRYSGIVLRGVQ